MGKMNIPAHRSGPCTYFYIQAANYVLVSPIFNMRKI